MPKPRTYSSIGRSEPKNTKMSLLPEVLNRLGIGFPTEEIPEHINIAAPAPGSFVLRAVKGEPKAGERICQLTPHGQRFGFTVPVSLMDGVQSEFTSVELPVTIKTDHRGVIAYGEMSNIIGMPAPRRRPKNQEVKSAVVTPKGPVRHILDYNADPSDIARTLLRYLPPGSVRPLASLLADKAGGKDDDIARDLARRVKALEDRTGTRIFRREDGTYVFQGPTLGA